MTLSPWQRKFVCLLARFSKINVVWFFPSVVTKLKTFSSIKTLRIIKYKRFKSFLPRSIPALFPCPNNLTFTISFPRPVRNSVHTVINQGGLQTIKANDITCRRHGLCVRRLKSPFQRLIGRLGSASNYAAAATACGSPDRMGFDREPGEARYRLVAVSFRHLERVSDSFFEQTSRRGLIRSHPLTFSVIKREIRGEEVDFLFAPNAYSQLPSPFDVKLLTTRQA